MKISDQLWYAKKVNNYIEDATDTGTGNDKFDSTTLQEYEVPAAKRWHILGGVVNRDVSATLDVTIRDSSDKIIWQLYTSSAATGITSYPSNLSATAFTQNPGIPIVLDAGEYINIAFGAAQGAGAYASCVVLEIDL